MWKRIHKLDKPPCGISWCCNKGIPICYQHRPYRVINVVATPLLEECEDDTHIPEMGTWESFGTWEFQSLISGVKTPRLEAFFISLERYRSLDVENGLARAIWTSKTQVMPKEGLGVKLTIWLPTTKNLESTWPRCVQVKCDTPLESSQGKLQVCFRPHPNRRSEQRVTNSQRPKNPNQDNFGTPWESWDKKPFGCRCRGKTQRILYGGRWWLPSSSGHGEFCESKVARGLS